MLKIARMILVGYVSLFACQATSADLQPDEVAIIAVQNSLESRELAEYYAKARGIPESHICLIKVAPGKTLDRTLWDSQVRPYIRNWLLERELEEQVRCLVTTWDVPLKIGKAPPEVAAGRKAFLAAERSLRVDRLAELVDSMNGVLVEAPPEAVEFNDEQVKTVNEAMRAAFEQLFLRLQETKGTAEGRAAAQKFLRGVAIGGGLRASIQVLDRERASDPKRELELATQIERLRGQLLGLTQGRNALDWLPESVEKDEQMLAITETAFGVLESLNWIDGQIQVLEKNETYSSFDSELSLIFWPRYPLMRWAPNVWNHQLDGNSVRRTRLTMMVSRLEAPTLELAKKLVDTAIEVEEKGLSGKVYLDARGLQARAQEQRGSTADYDQALRRLAAFLEENTDLEVVLDNRNELFGENACPDAALYCGWYSLAKYVDAFTFQPGAVGYHLASSEAATLRDPNSKVWCKRMLEDGINATLGPVHEPYLLAFPRPDEFFIVLCTGRHTLVETFYRTKPYNSWVMTLVGDPLYNPFKNHPAVKLEDLSPAMKKLAGGTE